MAKKTKKTAVGGKPRKEGPNSKEQKVFTFFSKVKKASLREAARACFKGVRPVQKADSQVRNSIRYWVGQKKLKKAERGVYEVRA